MTEAQTSRLLTDLAVEAIRERPGYYLAQTVEFAWQIMAGKPIDVRREGMPWREIDWERRIRHVLERPVNRLDVPRAQLLVSLHDPARYGPLVPILFGAGLALAALGLALRRLLLLGLIAVALIVSSAALVGPVLRYRVPADPFIALLSVQAVVMLAGLAFARFKAGTYPPRLPIEGVEQPTEAGADVASRHAARAR